MRDCRISIGILIFISGCKKPYDADVIVAPGSHRVVDGLINGASDSTVIKLNRTVRLSEGININAVPGAAVTIGYSPLTPYSVNCTLRGTNKQPSFWQ